MPNIESLLVKVLFAAVVLIAGAWWFTSQGAPIVIGPDPAAGNRVVILLHGHGAPADDLVPLAERLQKAAPDVTFLLPAGLHRSGLTGRTWYPQRRVSGKTQAEVENQAQALEVEMRTAARQSIIRIVRQLAKKGIEPADVTVGGFSQGAMVSLDVVLSEAGSTVGGLWFLSGGRLTYDFAPLGTRSRLKAVVSHGDQDRVLSDDVAKALVTALTEAGQEVEFVPFAGGHTIAPKVRKALAAYLAPPSS